MTMPANARPFGDRLPADADRKVANQLRHIIAAQTAQSGSARLRVRDDTGEAGEVVLTPALSSLMIDLLRYVGNGEAVTLVPVSKLLTTQQAADILNVSRPHLIKQLVGGALRYEMVGRHRRIRAEDLFAYKRDRDERREQALADLAAIDADNL